MTFSTPKQQKILRSKYLCDQVRRIAANSIKVIRFMRVLWFTNIPLLPVTRKLGLPDILASGSWMDSLRSSLQSYSSLELGIASTSDLAYKSFQEDREVFYNIPLPPQWKKHETVYRSWSHTIDFPNGLNNCLDIIQNFNPDLVHIHGTESFYGLISRETRIPVIISIQGIMTIIEKFFFGGFTLRDKLTDNFTKKLITGSSSAHAYLALKNKARREREIVKLCSYFIGRTEFDKNFVSLINPGSHYYHCDDALRTPFYNAEWKPRPSDRQIIYCTSGPTILKGLDCLLFACNILKSNGFINLQLRISGQIQNSDIWDVINRKVKSLNLENEIVWLGNCSAEAIVSELENANVFVLPSYIENASCALGEAMLVGVPCVASYVGGVPSEISHGEDGLFFSSGDYYTLAGMIAKILRDPLLAGTLSRNARIIAHQRHDRQTIASNIVKIYSDVINDFSEKKN